MKSVVQMAAAAVLVAMATGQVLHGAPTPQEQTSGVRMPTVVREVKPNYTPEALQAGIEGSVFLEIVVQDDGTVGEAKVKQSLDEKYGLDAEALKAVKQWLFKPGTKEGKPVPVTVEIEMTFKLK